MQTISTPLFDTVPQNHFLPLYGKGNHLDYEKVIKSLELPKKDVAAAANLSLTAVRYDQKMPRELKDRIEEWANLLELVAQHFQDTDKTFLWFKMPNPMLGNVSPRDMIRFGRSKKLLKLILHTLGESKR